MAIIVQKFGGTSLGNIERIKEVANIISETVKDGYQPIVIVSAMAGITNHLISLCHELSTLNNADNLAEYDVTIATGEIISAGLLALALQERSLKARSFSAWQLPIITNDHYTESFVTKIEHSLLKDCLAQAIIPIITGFQGINNENRITTIGRGGSDTSAVLIAAAINSRRCDIYTDVTGVFTADPRIVHHASKLEEVNSLEMLELASNGAKVLHPRSVELAIRYDIEVRVISSFTKEIGTSITNKQVMEARIITGITSNKNLFQLKIIKPVISIAEILELFTKNKIAINNFNIISTDYNFIIPANNKSFVEEVLITLKSTKKISDYNLNQNIALVTLVGFGIRNDLALPEKIIKMLQEKQIDILEMTINELKISIIINSSSTETAVKKLHELVN